MLTFVEQGTPYANDLGYGDHSFFSALESMSARALVLLQQSTRELRETLNRACFALITRRVVLDGDMAISLGMRSAMRWSRTRRTRKRKTGVDLIRQRYQ